MVSPYLNNAMSVLLTLTRVPLSSSLLFCSLLVGLDPNLEGLPNMVGLLNLEGLLPNISSSSDAFTRSFSFQSNSLSVSTSTGKKTGPSPLSSLTGVSFKRLSSRFDIGVRLRVILGGGVSSLIVHPDPVDPM